MCVRVVQTAGFTLSCIVVSVWILKNECVLKIDFSVVVSKWEVCIEKRRRRRKEECVDVAVEKAVVAQ